jgi:geranylgeranyl reductase family protein
MNTYDVVIIGAGPAGCACALALHGSGLKVALVDKETYPRDKVCGDAIPGKAFKAMDAILPAWGSIMRQFAHKTNIQTTKAFTPNGKSVSINWVLYSYNSKRLHFDDFLLQLVKTETETTVIESQRLQHVVIEKEWAECKFKNGLEVRASIVIGCDGANSIVKRQLHKVEYQNNYPCSAVRVYMKGVIGILEGVNECHFFNETPGYFWIFPLENGVCNVGFGSLDNLKGKDKQPINLRETLKNIITTFPSISSRFVDAEMLEDIKGFALPLGTKKQAISGERYMLCGDAASLIDPLSGHGIDKAFWSGVFAAKQAITCFQSSRFDANILGNYDKMVYDKVGAELRKNTIFMRIFIRYPSLMNPLTWMDKHQNVAEKIIRVFKF